MHCNELGLHEFEGSGVQVKGFRPGDEPAPGVEALQMGAIAPDDTVLWLDVPGGALLFADALIHYGGEVSFVPDSLMGDIPRPTSAGCSTRWRRCWSATPTRCCSPTAIRSWAVATRCCSASWTSRR